MDFLTHENASILSSPDMQSSKDTPATPLTCHSKDELVLSKGRICTVNAVKPPPFAIETRRYSIDASDEYGDNCNDGNSDPFIPSARSSMSLEKQRNKLSATANSFYPSNLSTSIDSLGSKTQTRTAPAIANGFLYPNNLGRTECVSSQLRIDWSNWARQTTASHPQSLGRQILSEDSIISAYAAITKPPISLATAAMIYDTAISVPDDAHETRYLIIANLPSDSFRVYLDAVLATPIVSQSRLAVIDHAASHGIVLLRYDDVRCAVSSLSKIRCEFPNWSCNFSSSQVWRSLSTSAARPFPSDYEGQIIIILSQQKQALQTRKDGPNCIQYYSKLVDLILMLHIEFCSLKAADAVENKGLKQPFAGLELIIKRYEGQLTEKHVQALSSHVWTMSEISSHRARSCIPGLGAATQPSAVNTKMQASLTTTITNKSRTRVGEGARQPDEAVPNHNAVDIDRIRNGQDVRTTIMLRNIPNKVDQPTLKAIVDESSLGKYDFMYLRIDFANNCNVGYAFINFEDSHSIINFVTSMAGRKWNCFNSDKVAEVSYATIQGRDCLIQKFRNSSVMLEAPLFRPKIYYTGVGSLAGQEEEFPSPDNHSKMRRSLENAEHVGLFAPRLSYRTREEQRRGLSRYDRGTRPADRYKAGNS